MKRNFEQDLQSIISRKVGEHNTVFSLAKAVEEAIANDDELVLYLTRPGLPGVLYKHAGEFLRSRGGGKRKPTKAKAVPLFNFTEDQRKRMLKSS